LFVPIASETIGAINSDGIEFLDDLGRRITQVTDDNREKAFLYQRLSAVGLCRVTRVTRVLDSKSESSNFLLLEYSHRILI